MMSLCRESKRLLSALPTIVPQVAILAFGLAQNEQQEKRDWNILENVTYVLSFLVLTMRGHIALATLKSFNLRVRNY